MESIHSTTRETFRWYWQKFRNILVTIRYYSYDFGQYFYNLRMVVVLPPESICVNSYSCNVRRVLARHCEGTHITFDVYSYNFGGYLHILRKLILHLSKSTPVKRSEFRRYSYRVDACSYIFVQLYCLQFTYYSPESWSV